MPAPPMNQDIILHIPRLDANGKPVLNRNSQVIRDPIETKARVKKTGEHIITDNGESKDAVLEVTFPPDVPMQTGDIVEWVDEFGVTIKGPIAKTSEARNYNGLIVYFRKGWTT